MPWAKTGPIDYFYATRKLNGKTKYCYVGRGPKADEYLRCLAAGEDFKLPPSQADEIKARHQRFNQQFNAYAKSVKQQIESASIEMGFHKKNSVWTLKRANYFRLRNGQTTNDNPKMAKENNPPIPDQPKLPPKDWEGGMLAPPQSLQLGANMTGGMTDERRAQKQTHKMKQTLTTLSEHLREMTIGSIPLEPKVQRKLRAELQAMKTRLGYDQRLEVVRIAIDQLVTAYAAHFVASQELYTRPVNQFEPREKIHLERQYHKTFDNLHRATVLVAAIEQRVARVSFTEPLAELPMNVPRPHHSPDFIDQDGTSVYNVWPTDPADTHWMLATGDVAAQQQRNADLHGFLDYYTTNPDTQPSDIAFIDVVRIQSSEYLTDEVG